MRKAAIRAWGGFVEDKLDTWPSDVGGPTQTLAIFRTRAEARKRYQDVRKIVFGVPATITLRPRRPQGLHPMTPMKEALHD